MQSIDTSDKHYADVLSAAYVAHERYLRTNSPADLKVWVELDRERARILDARQRERMEAAK